ncbi:hypothetical protein ACTHS0_11555, partial [Neisseria sp. P0013.S009]
GGGVCFCGELFGGRGVVLVGGLGGGWGGAIGGVLCVAVCVTIVWKAGWLAFGAGWFKTILIGLILVVVSVCGGLLGGWFGCVVGVGGGGGLLLGYGGVFGCVGGLVVVVVGGVLFLCVVRVVDKFVGLVWLVVFLVVGGVLVLVGVCLVLLWLFFCGLVWLFVGGWGGLFGGLVVGFWVVCGLGVGVGWGGWGVGRECCSV